jgi:hypothetical protein
MSTQQTPASKTSFIVLGGKGGQRKTTSADYILTALGEGIIRRVFEIEAVGQQRLSALLAARKSPISVTQITPPSAEAVLDDPNVQFTALEPLFTAMIGGGILADLGAGLEKPFFQAALEFGHAEECNDGGNIHFVISALATERLSFPYVAAIIAQIRDIYANALITTVIHEASGPGGTITEPDKKFFANSRFIIVPAIRPTAMLAPLLLSGRMTLAQLRTRNTDHVKLAEHFGVPELNVKMGLGRLETWADDTLKLFETAFPRTFDDGLEAA